MTDTNLASDLGQHYVARILQSRYGGHLQALGSNFLDFVNNIDYVHCFIGQNSLREVGVDQVTQVLFTE